MANFAAAALNSLGDSHGRTDHIEMQELIGNYFGSPGNDSSDEGMRFYMQHYSLHNEDMQHYSLHNEYMQHYSLHNE